MCCLLTVLCTYCTFYLLCACVFNCCNLSFTFQLLTHTLGNRR